MKPSSAIPLDRFAVEHACEGTATYASTEHVKETYEGETVWEGDVHIYTLEGNPEAETCYAWAEPSTEAGRDRIFVVLKVNPVKTATDAVRLSILQDYRAR